MVNWFLNFVPSKRTSGPHLYFNQKSSTFIYFYVFFGNWVEKAKSTYLETMKKGSRLLLRTQANEKYPVFSDTLREEKKMKDSFLKFHLLSVFTCCQILVCG